MQSLGLFTPPSWHSLVPGRWLRRCQVHSTLYWCGLHCLAPSPLDGALWTLALAPPYWSSPAPLQGCSCVSICSFLPPSLPSFLNSHILHWPWTCYVLEENFALLFLSSKSWNYRYVPSRLPYMYCGKKKSRASWMIIQAVNTIWSLFPDPYCLDKAPYHTKVLNFE